MATTKRPKKTYKTKSKNSIWSRRFSDKRFRILFFILLFAVAGGVYIFKTNALCVDACGQSARSKIVSVAKYQIGQKENPLGSDRGAMVSVYTQNIAEPWCADFVSWVYKTSGYPFHSAINGPGWRYSVASKGGVGSYRGYSILTRLSDTGRYKPRGTYRPLPGDIIVFNEKTYYSHVGIVESTENNSIYGVVVHTIEGNSVNSVKRNTYGINDNKILGYGDMF